MPVPFLSIIVLPLQLVVWLSNQPWGPFVAPAFVGLTMIVAGIAIIRAERNRRY